jgi:hypothetical protein
VEEAWMLEGFDSTLQTGADRQKLEIRSRFFD